MSKPLNPILLVDDEPRLLSALRRRLSSSFDVHTATSGAEALDLLADNAAVKVIVADMQMPQMNGIELLKQVKSAHPKVRRVMLTGNADQETAVAAINEGQVMRFLRKPCDASELAAILQQGVEEFDFQCAANSDAFSGQGSPDSGEKARQAFLAVMNHELRTPLNHIIGLATVLENNPEACEGENADQFLNQIKESGEQMLLLVNRILEFSRLRSKGSGTEDAGAFDVLKIIKAEVDALHDKAAAKAVTVSVDCLRLSVDVEGFEQEAQLAFRELLQNAIKFNIDGGHIGIAVKCEKDKAAIRIFNTGGGVPDDLMDRICKPFRLGDESYSRINEGIGLGLAIVSAVAEINRAKFSIKAHETGGMVATLAFKRKLPSAAAAPLAATA